MQKWYLLKLIQESGEGVNSSMTYLIHCKNFCKYYNVSPLSTTVIKEKKDLGYLHTTITVSLMFPGLLMLLISIIFFELKEKHMVMLALVVMDSLNFCQSKEVLNSQFLKDSFAGYGTLGWQIFFPL
jgi:hypothetical protein